jgi:hypothetical protein
MSTLVLSNCFCPAKMPVSPPSQQANIHKQMPMNKSLFGGLFFIALVKGPVIGSEW